MNAATKYLKLSGPDKALFARALIAVAIIRLGLSLIGYKRLIKRMPAVSNPPKAAIQPGRLAWAVRNVAPITPKASCLTQAIAVQYLLARAGEASEIRIGVAPDGDTFRAHAWLTWNDHVVIGGEYDLGQYTHLTTLAPEPR
jgi:hypothetical protein